MEKLNQILKNQGENSHMSTKSVNLIEINYKNWAQMSNEVFKIGRKFSKEFVLNEEKQIIFKNLLNYFTGNEGKLDLGKGIYLHGEYGIGKTVTMSIFSRFLATCFPFSSNGYGITSIEKIAEHYKQKGDLAKFGRCVSAGSQNKASDIFFETELTGKRYCINEFGKPLNEKHFGTNIQDVVNSMLMVRYELFQEKGILTHATSNFAPERLDCFDSALLDRFSEMFNFIELKGESHR